MSMAKYPSAFLPDSETTPGRLTPLYVTPQLGIFSPEKTALSLPKPRKSPFRGCSRRVNEGSASAAKSNELYIDTNDECY